MALCICLHFKYALHAHICLQPTRRTSAIAWIAFVPDNEGDDDENDDDDDDNADDDDERNRRFIFFLSKNRISNSMIRIQ